MREICEMKTVVVWACVLHGDSSESIRKLLLWRQRAWWRDI